MGCNLMIDANREQCESNGDCAARDERFANSVCDRGICVPDPHWSCLDAIQAAPNATQEAGLYRVEVPVVDVLSLQPLPGVQAKRCRKIDVECDEPLGDVVLSDEDGLLGYVLETGFNGYLALSGAGISPSYYFFNPPVSRDETMPPIRLASPETVEALTQAVGMNLQPERGLVVLTAHDCLGEPLAGVSYPSPDGDPDVVPFYSVGGLPTTETVATDESGYGGLLNVRAGTVPLTGVHAEHGVLEQFSVSVNRGALSYARVVPLGS